METLNLRKEAEGKPCILCGKTDGVVLHHIQIAGNHGTGIKPDDFPWGVRLCHDCHAWFHGEGRSDHRGMVQALGQQMIAYVREGIVRL